MENTITLPEVGMGVTISVGSDCYAGTITTVSEDKRRFTYTEDITKLIAGSCQSEHQEYSYTPDPTGDVQTARFSNKTNRFYGPGGYKHGRRVHVGHRRYYQDPCF
jgi:hypothetical protein